jgi:hypothetical protein
MDQQQVQFYQYQILYEIQFIIVEACSWCIKAFPAVTKQTTYILKLVMRIGRYVHAYKIYIVRATGIKNGLVDSYIEGNNMKDAARQNISSIYTRQ